MLGLLTNVHQLGLSLEARDGKVVLCGSTSSITEVLRRMIKAHKADLLKALSGELQPVPSIRSLANAYRTSMGAGFREAFLRETGCDHFEQTPEWIQLYLFRDWLAAAQQERYEERAAIMEFDGGLTRAEAEKRARKEVFGHE